MSIQKQWDPAISAFNTLERITALVKAGTVDDVQPQAVIAAEHLGSLMIVHPQRIGQAIDALGGSNSFRLENVKLSLGLSSGGIAAQIRNSTPAIRCFLFAACLSLHLTPSEIGSFLYEMMERAGLLETIPVSPAQLTSFVTTLEGHMKELLSREQVAATSLSPLLDILSCQTSSNQEHFQPLNPKLASAIFLETFQAIRSEEVTSAELSGGSSAVWIASTFSWLCPTDVSIMSKDQDERRNKIRISPLCGEWKLQKWYSITDFTTIIFRKESRESTLLCANRSIGYNYWQSVGMTSNELTIVGHIVRELLRASYRFGKIRTRPHRDYSEHPPTPFRSCCSPIWVKNLATLHDCFGWPATPIENQQEFERISQEIREIIEAHAAKSTEKHRYADDYPVCKQLHAWVARQPAFDANTCVTLALRIAEDLFLEACYIDRSERRLRLFSMEIRPRNSFWSLLIHVVSTGIMYVDDFIIKSLAIIDPDLTLSPEPRFVRWPLVVSGQGLVAYPSMVQNFSLSPSEAMGIIILPVCVRWRDTRYTRIIEPVQGEHLSPSERFNKQLELFDKDGSPLPGIGVTEELLCSVDLSISYNREELLLSTQIVVKNPVDGCVLFRANRFFHRAMGNIATAHIAEAEHASSEALIAEARSLPRYYPIYLVQINDGRRNNFKPVRRELHPELVEDNFKGVLTYTGSPSVSCLLAGPRTISFPLVIQGSASLLECVIQAHRVWRRKSMLKINAEYLLLPTRPN